ncbi:MAG: gamma-glutamyltransferase family protein [Gammaproteobacteria bacterium]
MLNTLQATHGMAVAPHALAAQAGLGILQDGGTALEAAVGMAAALSVLYPHMTGIGGDSFWVVAAPGEAVTTIDACGRTPAALDSDYYRQRGLGAVPIRGPHAANTVAGTLSGWHAALELSRYWGGRLPLSRLLEEAIGYADSGYEVSASQARCTARKCDELRDEPGFADVYLPSGRAPGVGATLRQPALGQTLGRLAGAGIDDFYRGELAAAVAADLAVVGSPVALEDLQAQRALTGAPLALSLGGHLPAGMLYSTAPPTQGIVTLLILGQFANHSDALPPVDSPDYVHLLVEATKQAFPVRDRMVCDPQDMAGVDLGALLEHAALAERAGAIDMHEAAPWGEAGDPGDTTWFGVIDGEGRAVSCIQSLYHEFGSGVVLPTTGICWQNRGSSFSLDPDHPRYLRPNRKPFHTLCPSLARFDDGRVMPFGTMGGDGQPQTQAAVFTRYAAYGQSLQEAVSAPRWLLGRTWGASSDNLKLEGRFGAHFAQTLADRGHAVETVADYDEMMGHAGALVLRPDGVIEGAADPRSDGAAVGY